jgi:hypothetical protein
MNARIRPAAALPQFALWRRAGGAIEVEAEGFRPGDKWEHEVERFATVDVQGERRPALPRGGAGVGPLRTTRKSHHERVYSEEPQNRPCHLHLQGFILKLQSFL